MNGGGTLDLSEQQVLNCNPAGYDCNGGWATTAWSWMRSNRGIATESQIPYQAGSGSYASNGRATCTAPTNAAGTSSISWTSISPENDDGLVAALQSTPIKIGLYAGLQFMLYDSGIIDCTAAESEWYVINHEIQMVGCTSVPDAAGVMTPVYIVKNEWSTWWGSLGGFAYIKRYSAADRPYGTCGIASDADWLS